MLVLTSTQPSSPMPLNVRREALVIEPWQANQRKKGQNWQKKTTSDLTAPQRSLTASLGLWRISVPSALCLRLAQSHHHPGAPGQRQTSSKNNDASATVPSNYT